RLGRSHHQPTAGEGRSGRRGPHSGALRRPDRRHAGGPRLTVLTALHHAGASDRPYLRPARDPATVGWAILVEPPARPAVYTADCLPPVHGGELREQF